MGFFKLKRIQVFSNIFLGLFLSLFSLWVFQENPKTQKRIFDKLVNVLEQEWKADISVSDYKINFFTGNIVLNNGNVFSKKSSGKNFSWSFKRADIRFSRLMLFFKNFFLLDVNYNNVVVQSVFFNNNLDIKEHLENVALSESSVSSRLRSLKVKNIVVNINNKKDKVTFNLKGSYGFKNMGNIFKKPYLAGFLNLKKGFVVYNDFVILKDIFLKSIFFEKDLLDNKFNVDLFGKFKVCLSSGNKDCIIKLNKQSVNIFDPQDNLLMVIDFNNLNQIRTIGSLNILFLKDLFDLFNGFERKTRSRIQASHKATPHMVKCGMTQPLHKALAGASHEVNPGESKPNKFDALCKFDFIYDLKKIRGNFILSKFTNNFLRDKSFYGDVFVDIKKRESRLNLKNLKALDVLNEFKLFPGDFLVSYDLFKSLGDFSLLFNGNTPEIKKIAYSGNFLLNRKGLNLSAHGVSDRLILSLGFLPNLFLEKILYLKTGKKIVDCSVGQEKRDKKNLTGFLDLSFFKRFIPEDFKKKILGSIKKCDVFLDQTDLKKLRGRLFFNGGKLSFVNNYNPIENVELEFLFKSELMQFDIGKLEIKFLKGTINSSSGLICFDDNFSLGRVDLPIKVNNFLFNWKNDFYSLCDANFFITKEFDKRVDVKGTLVFRKSFLNSNFLNFDNSLILKYSFLRPVLKENSERLNFDINITSLEPLKLRGDVLNSDINLDLNLGLKVADEGLFYPELTGSLDMKNGALNFFEKKLLIDYGKIQFLPNRIDDPVIDLVAKNKINEYLISLQIIGSLNVPKVILESYPRLEEKQILGLLLAGSKDMNLQSQLSFVLQKNFKNIVADNQKQNIFKKIFNPFRYIQITPNFINNIGKNGFKGSVDVDVNERLHAKIQKDFNLNDDFSMQFEYFASDDVNFRLLKDQRDELGAEVEVRFRL